MPKRKEMQKRYRELKDKLPITSNGYEYVVRELYTSLHIA